MHVDQLCDMFEVHSFAGRCGKLSCGGSLANKALQNFTRKGHLRGRRAYPSIPIVVTVNCVGEQGTASRSLLYAMSAAFIAAALLAGISTVYAVHMGVEALSLLHDSQSSSTRQMLQGSFARATLTRADVRALI
jgi:ammonia channel protein AmtB